MVYQETDYCEVSQCISACWLYSPIYIRYTYEITEVYKNFIFATVNTVCISIYHVKRHIFHPWILFNNFWDGRLFWSDPLLSRCGCLCHSVHDCWSVGSWVGINAVHPETVGLCLTQLQWGFVTTRQVTYCCTKHKWANEITDVRRTVNTGKWQLWPILNLCGSVE